jgi:hypothetical protein
LHSLFTLATSPAPAAAFAYPDVLELGRCQDAEVKYQVIVQVIVVLEKGSMSNPKKARLKGDTRVWSL